jgi:hypothetical protein
VKTPIRLCAAALERSSSEVSSGILIRGNYKKKKNQKGHSKIFAGKHKRRRKKKIYMRKIKKNKYKVIQNLCFDTMLKVMLYIESHSIMYRIGLFI